MYNSRGRYYHAYSKNHSYLGTYGSQSEVINFKIDLQYDFYCGNMCNLFLNPDFAFTYYSTLILVI